MNHFYTDIYSHHQLFRRPVLLGFYNDVMHFVAVLFLLLACPDVQGTSAKTGNSLIKMIAFRSVKTKTKSKVNLELKQLYKVSSIMHIFEFANTSVVQLTLNGEMTGNQLQFGGTQNTETRTQLECGLMPNVMAALPNTGGALCSTPQSLADAH